jgi:hypothetical protein
MVNYAQQMVLSAESQNSGTAAILADEGNPRILDESTPARIEMLGEFETLRAHIRVSEISTTSTMGGQGGGECDCEGDERLGWGEGTEESRELPYNPQRECSAVRSPHVLTIGEVGVRGAEVVNGS